MNKTEAIFNYIRDNGPCKRRDVVQVFGDPIYSFIERLKNKGFITCTEEINEDIRFGERAVQVFYRATGVPFTSKPQAPKKRRKVYSDDIAEKLEAILKTQEAILEKLRDLR